MKLFFFRLKDDYSGFDETDFSARIPAARRRKTAGGRRRRCRVASDGFLSSLLERIMNSGVRRSLGNRASPTGYPSRVLLFSPSIPSSAFNDLKIECVPFLHSPLCPCALDVRVMVLRQEPSLDEFYVIHLYENSQRLIMYRWSWRVSFNSKHVVGKKLGAPLIIT